MSKTSIQSQDWEINLAKLIAKTWADDNFRQRFVANPAAILREAGMILEDSVKVIVNQGGSSSSAFAAAEGGTSVYEIDLPSKPSDLDEEQINVWFDQTFPHRCHHCRASRASRITST